MEGLALLLWIVTIGGGLTLGFLWVRRGGWARPADADPSPLGSGQQTDSMVRPRSKIGLSVIVPHATLGIVGAVSWMLYRANRDDTVYDPMKWLALALLLGTISLGLLMFGRWLADRRSEGDDPGEGPPERRLPPVVVLLHGMSAAATLVLVVVAIIA